VSVALCEKALQEAGLPQRIVIDCSHGNSNKDPALQPLVARDCFEQIINGNRSIFGFMLESNLREGNQPVNGDPSALEYGVSVTDACIGWETTEQVLEQAAQFLRPTIQGRKTA
jgi:3-deoxy-7-phosphoheptulonate synthase